MVAESCLWFHSFPATETKGMTQIDDTSTFKRYHFYNNLYIQIVSITMCRGEAPQAKLIEIPSTSDLVLLTETRIFRGQFAFPSQGHHLQVIEQSIKTARVGFSVQFFSTEPGHCCSFTWFGAF